MHLRAVTLVSVLHRCGVRTDDARTCMQECRCVRVCVCVCVCACRKSTKDEHAKQTTKHVLHDVPHELGGVRAVLRGRHPVCREDVEPVVVVAVVVVVVAVVVVVVVAVVVVVVVVGGGGGA